LIDHGNILPAFDRSWQYSPDEVQAGENVKVDSPDYSINGVLQPATFKDLQSLPENQRINLEYLLHTRETLSIDASAVESGLNTYIRLSGKEYKVVKFKNFGQWNMNRYGLQNTESSQRR
jgi:hypothetical protein